MHHWKRLTSVVALTVLVVAAGFGIVRLGAITYGSPDGNGHPNVGVMLFTRSDMTGTFRLCTGTLIADQVFLTASHCTAYLDGLVRQGVSVEVGVSFSSGPPHIPAMIPGTYHTNPEYYSLRGIDDADVAVIVLDHAPVGLAPAQLPPPGMFDAWFGTARRAVKDLRFTAVGYGSLAPTFGGGPPVFPSSGGNRYFSYSRLASIDPVWLHLQANDATGDGGTCYGDSGGPNFLWQDGAETDIIAGVTVTGDAMCVATNVIYRLDTPTARRFLGQFVVLPQ